MNNNETPAEDLNEPWEKPWPTDGLESIQQCPVCGGAEREILHTDLIDNAFRVGLGKWTLWRCSNCSSAYLDPRPTEASVYMAYTNYYTHKEVAKVSQYASLSIGHKLRCRLINGYTNWRYSTDAQPSSSLGILAAFAIPSLKRSLDRKYRHMPSLSGRRGVLLDVGCGDGTFLGLARSCGWEVVGLDTDTKAVANAAKLGVTVYKGGIEHFAGKSELFDLITLNHVIEHLHDPVGTLHACYSLLKPSGHLWLETPNIDSFGHERFQKNWRGLESPRHLVLFNQNSLRNALLNAGFSSPHELVSPSACTDMIKKSFAMEKGNSPYQAMAIPVALQWHAKMAELLEAFYPSRREFLTVTAQKMAR